MRRPRPSPTPLLFLLCGCLAGAALTGCDRAAQQLPRPPSEPEKRLIEICQQDYQLTVTTRRVGQTLWVYAPVEEPFFYIKVSDEGPQPAQPPTEAMTIHYLEGDFDQEAQAFHLRYDIGLAKKGSPDYGYGMQYSDQFSNMQRYLMTAAGRAYGDTERRAGQDGEYERVDGDVDYLDSGENYQHKRLVHSYVKTQRVPDFLVLVVADVKTGLEARCYVYLPDLKRGMTDQTFGEEYTRRIVRDNPVGQTDIIGDTTGAHLKMYDLSWSEFLSRQIVYRVRFKYQQSDFPPGDDPQAEIMRVVAATLGAYPWKNFQEIQLDNLAEGKRYSYSKDDLAAYAKDEDGRRGNLQTISVNLDPNAQGGKGSGSLLKAVGF